MVRCHECNSKVADNDLYCPYCGVMLKTASEEAVGEVVPVDDFSVNATTEPNMADVDVPETIEDYARTSDNVMSQPTSEYAIIPDDAIEISDDTSERAAATPAPNESIELSKEDKLIELSEVTEAVPDEVDAPESESIGIVAPASVSDEEEADDEAPTVLGGGVFEERPFTPDQSISRPAQDLEPAEAPKSMFDSVRIIESKPRPDDVDTRIQGVSEPVPEPPPPAILTEQTNVEPKPYTEPNMGMGTGGDTDGKRSAKLKPLGEGTILNNRYEIVRKIGGGGMGAVYLASDNNLGGVLRAVKEMVQSHIEEEQQEKAINDFKRESMILSTLDHPSIPTIYDYFYDADEGRFYLVMKYISGGDLASRLRSAPEGKIDEKSVTQWAVQIADVLDYLHCQPSTIVYRDLKPSNIMIDGNTGRIMLIDFGIARSISQKEEKGVTAVGTMGYAPPELFSGNVEPRSDIYSLGSTIFHLLTGADPQSNPLLIFDFQKNPRPRQINSQLSDQIERIIMRSVEYSADSRFGSAAEIKAVLEEHLESLRSGNVTYGVTAIPASISLENQSVFCGFCGQRIVATDLFCAFCGAKQPIAQQGVHSEIYTRSAPTAKLIIEGTSELTTPAFSLQKDENLVGRRDPMSNIFPEVDLSKYDPQTKISRRHARIWRDGSNFLVEDLGSSNGTILASAVTDSLRLIPHKPHILTSGDKLKVGDTTLHFLIG